MLLNSSPSSQPTSVSPEKERLARFLGVDQESSTLRMIVLTLQDLSGVVVREDELEIKIPTHLAANEITDLIPPSFSVIPNCKSIFIRKPGGLRTAEAPPPAREMPKYEPISLSEESLPEIPQEIPSSDPILSRIAREQDAKINLFISQLVDALGIEASSGARETTKATLDTALSFKIKNSENTRGDGAAFISFKEQSEALSFIQSLGFKPKNRSAGDSIWSQSSFEISSPKNESKASAYIAWTAKGVDVTIHFGEPLTPELYPTREVTGLATQPIY